MHSGADFKEIWVPKCAPNWDKNVPKGGMGAKRWKRVFAAICNGTEGFLRSRMPGFKEKTLEMKKKHEMENCLQFSWILIGI